MHGGYFFYFIFQKKPNKPLDFSGKTKK